MRDITEQQQARAALEESLSLYKATLESTADGLLVADLHGRMVSWNRKFMEMWRMPEDLCNSRNEEKGLAYILDQLQDPEGFLTKVKELYAHPETEDFDTIHFKDGRVFERYSIPQYLENRIVGRVWSFRDVTTRVRAEEALRQSEENFRLINENIQDVFWMSTASLDKIIYVSPAYEKLWGRTRESLYASPQSFLDGIHPEDRERAIDVVSGGHAQGIPWNVEYRVIRPDGSIRWIQDRGFPIKDGQGNLRLLTGVATDITERKLAEEGLRESEERLVKAEQVARLGHWDLDLKNQKLAWSKEVYLLFSKDPDTFVPTFETFLDTIHPEDRERFLCIRDEAVAEGRNFTVDYRIILPDGSSHFMQEIVEVTRNGVGNPTRIFGTIQDITELKQAEEEVAWLASFPQLNPDPVLEVKPSSGRITYCNPATIQALEKLEVSEGPQAFLPPDMDQILKTPGEENISRFYREVQIKDTVFGENIEFVPQYKVIRIRAFDITEHKRAKDALRQERDFIAALLQTLGALVIVMDCAGRVVRFNRACEQATGYTFQEVKGKHIF